MRFDHPGRSFITDPSAAKTIVLNHASKEAQEFPHAPSLTKPQLPQMGIPGFTPPQSPIDVKDLGKRVLNGHEVEGKLLTFSPIKPPEMPKPPEIPKPPELPKPPGMPEKPTLPEVAAAIPKPHQVEVWTSPKFQLPLATRVTGDLGKQTTFAKQVKSCQPPPASFQIPPDYKVVPPSHAPTTSS